MVWGEMGLVDPIRGLHLDLTVMVLNLCAAASSELVTTREVVRSTP